MRITNNMMSNTMLRNLNTNLTRLDKYQQQMSTGKKFSMPSDDPIGVSKSLTLNTAVSELKQHKKNTEDALSWMEITEAAVKDVGDVLQRIRELAVQADGVETKEDKVKIKAEIDQLRSQVINIANTTYGGKSIFTGYKTDQKLIDATTGQYLITSKDNEVMEYGVGINDTLGVNVLGHKLFGAIQTKPSYDLADPDEKNAFDAYINNLNNINSDSFKEVGTLTADADKGTYHAHIIKVIDSLSKSLETDNAVETDKAIGQLDGHLQNILKVRAEVGSKVNRLELSLNRNEDDTINFTKLLSQNEDADYAETLLKYTNDESVYRAALSIGARIIQPTLMDFLR